MDWRGRRQKPQCRGPAGQPIARWRRAPGGVLLLLRFCRWMLRTSRRIVLVWAYWSFLAHAYWYRPCFRSVIVARKTLRVPRRRFTPQEQELGPNLFGVVLADTEDTWNAIFWGLGGALQERAGGAVLQRWHRHAHCHSAVGPVYCPWHNQAVILDLGWVVFFFFFFFFRDLKQQLAHRICPAPMWIAHEVRASRYRNLMCFSQKDVPLVRQKSPQDQ